MIRRRPWREWTLRTRLVVTIAALAALALLAADLAGVVLMRQYLMGRVDEQLRGQSRGLARLAADRPFPPIRPGPGLGGESRVYLYAADGTLRRESTSTAHPTLPSFGSLRSHAGKAAFTVAGTD